MSVNWRTNLGGALGVLGTSLIGIGTLPQLAGMHATWLTVTATIGFFISAFGKFFHALFTPDTPAVERAIQTAIQTAVDKTLAAVAKSIDSGDTEILTRPNTVKVDQPRA